MPEDAKKERIGEFLVRIGAMTQKQADKVLERQKKGSGRLFGEIALELGYIDSNAIDAYLNAHPKRNDDNL